MKKGLISAGILSLVVIVAYSFLMIQKGWKISKTSEFSILLVYTSFLKQENSHILKAYKSVLKEEGIPFESIGSHLLQSIRVDDVAKNHPAVIFPDGAARYLMPGLEAWVKEYLRAGGNVIVVYDAGTVSVKKAFLKEALFSDITGINYMTYGRYGEEAYTLGNIKFMDRKSSDFFQVPFGKTEEGLLLGGYAYGKLEYPIVRNEYRLAVTPEELYATVVTQKGEEFPALVVRNYGKGKVLYANLPLGHLKCFSDDLPLRSVLRAFLLKSVKIPHLLNTPYGKGGLVINWHIDSSIDWESVDFMLKEGYLIKELKYSLHVTAGDFRDEPDDGLGFDACGQGKKMLELIKEYGVVGSHGGWAHNWFSSNIEKNRFGRSDIYEYIQKNNECLESVVGYKIVEYAAPNGTHPQPMTTEVLEDLGFIAYYYTGDTGSSPNRTFFNGKMISNRTIAFPILPYGKSASFYEMELRGLSEENVRKWLFECVNFVMENRTVRLIYSHPYDIPEYPKAIKSFLEFASQKQKEGKISVDTMTSFAEFFLRFLKTEYHFSYESRGLVISLDNPEGLQGITVGVPKAGHYRPDSPDLSIVEDEDFFYVTVIPPAKEIGIVLDLKKE